jgi:hypothetical protein
MRVTSFHLSFSVRQFIPRFFLLTICIAFSLPLKAQTPDDATEEKIEKLAEESGEEVDMNTLLDKLLYYREHKIDLNNTNREQLKELMVLNDIQIEAIFNHITGEGKFIALQELQTIDELDQETILRLLPFVTINSKSVFEKFSMNKILNDGKNSVIIRYQQVLEDQAGYAEQTEDNYKANKSYAGSQQKLYMRYRYNYGSRISFGITGEKDAGEQFFKGNQKEGFDFYSAHLWINGRGLVRTIAIGDFQAQYGQGVVLWSGLAFGKSTDVLNLKKNGRGIVPYTSTDENAFLRGGAVAFGLKKFQLDVFYSQHKIDGNIENNPDTANEEEDIITSFLEGGYHRTLNENNNKHTVTESHAGGHISYKTSELNIGATAVTTNYSVIRAPAPSDYNQYDFSGDHNFNSGVDISYLFRNISLFGEAGQSQNGAWGALAGALLSLDPRLGFSILHRHFDRDYQALLSNAISESSKDQNESGTMFGISAKPVRYFLLNVYYDMFKFPWLKYQVDAPSSGYECVAQLNYTPSRSFDAYFRFKQQNKPENFTGDEAIINGLQDAVQSNYRFNIKYKVTKSITLANRVEYVTLEKMRSGMEKGFMVYQDVNYKPMKSKFSFSLRYVMFDTDSYDARIYAYENDVLYAYSIPSYYYRGSKYYLMVHYSIVRGIDCWMRFGRTVYNNQETVSSDLEEINAPHKTEVKAQVRFQF